MADVNSRPGRTDSSSDTKIDLHGEDWRTVGEFDVVAGQEVAFTLTWTPSFHAVPAPLNATEALEQNQTFWAGWSAPFKRTEQWSEAILRSLLTLKALTHWETGGIVAAGTTSLPEKLGGPRNWDYRFCWPRDATFTLYALMEFRLSCRGECLARVAAPRRRRKSRQTSRLCTASPAKGD